MLFSIIIPCFNCKDTIHLPLISLAGQIFKDFEVILVDDKSTKPWHYEVEPFKKYMPIEIIVREENGGPGPTLQTGLDAAKGDYFIPIDSDDQLATAETLFLFARLIQQHQYPDAISTTFTEYDPVSGRMTPIDQNNSAFVHGKCFNVSFCRKNDIKFPQQKWFEDGTFNFQALNVTDRIVRDPNITYLWRSNPESITRSRDYNVEVMPYYIRAYEIAFPRVKKAKDDRAAFCFLSGVLQYGFYYWNAFKRRNVDRKKLNNLITLIGNLLRSSGLIEAMNGDRFIFDQMVINDTNSKRNIESQEGQLIPFMSLNDWLKKYFGKKIVWME